MISFHHRRNPGRQYYPYFTGEAWRDFNAVPKGENEGLGLVPGTPLYALLLLFPKSTFHPKQRLFFTTCNALPVLNVYIYLHYPGQMVGEVSILCFAPFSILSSI